MRRIGDQITIPGDYQYRAVQNGFVVQRFWHSLKRTEVVDKIGDPAPEMVVLDLGCGSGVVADYLASRARLVHAIDGNEAAISFARSKFNGANLKFHNALVEDLEFEEEFFDQIYMIEVIEHLYYEQIQSLFRLLHGKLKPGGNLIVTTPNYLSPWPLIEKFLDVTGLAPRMAGDQHVTKLNPQRLTAIAQEAGFQVVTLQKIAGIAPFLSVFGWPFANFINRVESRIGNPLGSLLCGKFLRS